MRRQLLAAVTMVAALTVVTGLLYPLAVTGVAQGLFPDEAEGSLVTDADGDVVGSSLLGQSFTEPQYFHPRPSAAGDGYDPTSSSGSNLGPTNPALADEVRARVAEYREDNGLALGTRVPVDAVTASASGLDPDISVANARLQAPRVAEERGLTVDEVEALVGEHTSGPALGVLGAEAVDVLALNLALDRASSEG
jgi:potassium-transporting ATPase KdpC subunit